MKNSRDLNITSMCQNYKQIGIALSQGIGQEVRSEAEEVRPNQVSLQNYAWESF